MPKIPRPIKEIAITPMFGEVFCVEIASKRAFDWFNKEAGKFGTCSVKQKDNKCSAMGVLVVSSCFDVSEVIEYLSHPEYVENNVLKIVE